MSKTDRLARIDKSKASKRVEKIFAILKRAYPDARTSLNHETAFELLVATILAAQCTDKRVNTVTQELFKKYRSCEDWAKADVKQIEEDIRSTGFYRNKAKNIKKTARLVMDDYGGEVPRDMDGLLSLAGVGRKTANVILGNCFDTPGIVCDTHVIRLSRRLGLSVNSDPVKLEFDLMETVPKKKWGGWTLWSHLMVFHGRSICKARKADCDHCPIKSYCPAFEYPELM
jgi:endonuclease-3